jgi:hypothetical protein
LYQGISEVIGFFSNKHTTNCINIRFVTSKTFHYTLIASLQDQ